MLSRREFLKISAGFALAVSGCSASKRVVEVLYAGSLQKEIEERIKPEFEAKYNIRCLSEAKTSISLLRLVKDGYRNPDVVISADAELLEKFLFPDIIREYTIFASNSIVIASNLTKPDEDRWIEQILSDEYTCGISDPATDPLGYRTLIVLKLAEIYYGIPIYNKIIDRLLVFGTEMDLMANLETNIIDMGFVYRNMASSHKISFIELPDEINLSNPSYEKFYQSVEVTVNGNKIKGSPILYGVAVPERARNRENGRLFMEFFLSRGMEILRESGFIVKGMPIVRRLG